MSYQKWEIFSFVAFFLQGAVWNGSFKLIALVKQDYAKLFSIISFPETGGWGNFNISASRSLHCKEVRLFQLPGAALVSHPAKPSSAQRSAPQQMDGRNTSDVGQRGRCGTAWPASTVRTRRPAALPFNYWCFSWEQHVMKNSMEWNVLTLL